MEFYSQDSQDRYLEENVFRGYKNGFYMDIGAHDGISINNTLFFEKNHNWTGVNVEPIKEIFENLKINRPKSLNLNLAICNNDGKAEFIYNRGYTEMISGLNEYYDHRHKKRLEKELNERGGDTNMIFVDTKKIETICEENNIKK